MRYQTRNRIVGGPTLMGGSSRHPVVHVQPMGRMANQMIQYMAAVSLARRVPGSVISNVCLPEWKILHPAIEAGNVPAIVANEPDRMNIDVAAAARMLVSGAVRRVELGTYAQHMANFPDRTTCQGLFVPPHRHAGFDARHLVINIRAGEILGGTWHYPLLPIDFYADLIARTRLRPVFMGQLGTDPYCGTLRARFPTAIFVESLGPVGDFETIRASKNIVLSVSTFTWLAAWLSEAEQVFLPLAGFFAPGLLPQTDLLPLDDPRYRWFVMPVLPGMPVMEAMQMHRAVSGLWREASAPMVRRMRDEAPRFAVDMDELCQYFDEDYYCTTYPDVQAALADGAIKTGQEHFRSFGHLERRWPFRLDAIFYARTNPQAAIEVGQGDFQSLHHQWVAIGKRRGDARFDGDKMARQRRGG